MVLTSNVGSKKYQNKTKKKNRGSVTNCNGVMHDPSAGHKYEITAYKKQHKAYTFKEKNGIGRLQLAAGTSHLK